MQLVLSEEYHPVGSATAHLGGGRVDGAQRDVEFCLAEVVTVLGEGQHQTVREVAHYEECVAVLDSHVGRQTGGVTLDDVVLGAGVDVGLDERAAVGAKLDDADFDGGLVEVGGFFVVFAPLETVVKLNLELKKKFRVNYLCFGF